MLSKQHPDLYEYCFYNCKSSFINCIAPVRVNRLCEIIAKDVKAYYLYFMHMYEIKRKNYMVAFAYFKNFFDRVTAALLDSENIIEELKQSISDLTSLIYKYIEIRSK